MTKFFGKWFDDVRIRPTEALVRNVNLMEDSQLKMVDD